MNNFNTNFSEVLLLANQNVKFWTEDGSLTFELIPMKTKDMFLNNDLIWFLNFLETDLNDFNAIKETYNIETHFDFIRTMCALSVSEKSVEELAKRFLVAMQMIVPEINLKNRFLLIKETILTQSMFDEIFRIVYRIMGKKEEIKILDSDDEMTRKMKAMQKKIQEIKSKGRKMNESSTKFEDMFAALLYEYPQYKMQDLFELNIHTFYYLFRYVGKIANYEVSKIAAGNGLSKKHKYFIEK